ncbi:MAG: hypothetical protein JWQ62_1090 [Lacunisphaera sp.]|nr:hypothetical protein [Lacunisphaera sp.]
MKPFPLRFLCLALALAAIPALAAQRTLTVAAPDKVSPNSPIHVEVAATTDATDAEQIGFFQPEYSNDGGTTWTPAYGEKMGKSAKRGLDFQSGAEGSKAMVRVRVAFRGGKAGDVDFSGKPIAWGGSWGKWETPPAKAVTIPITAQP